MLERIERRNRRIWEGHPRSFEDTIHTIGGIGIGFLAYGLVRPIARPLGIALVALSLGLHAYAALVKPSGRRTRAPTVPGRYVKSVLILR